MSTLTLHPYLGDFFREVERFRASESIHYDLIHSHYWLSGQVGKWLEDRWKVPHMVMFHTLGALKNTDRSRGAGVRASYRHGKGPGAKLSAHPGCHREGKRAFARTTTERVPRQIGVAPCGVNLDRFRPMDKKTRAGSWDIADDESMVLYVGQACAHQGNRPAAESHDLSQSAQADTAGDHWRR